MRTKSLSFYHKNFKLSTVLTKKRNFLIFVNFCRYHLKF